MVTTTLDTNFTHPNLIQAGFTDDFNRANGPVTNTPGGKPWVPSSPTGTDMPLVVSSSAAKRGTGGTASRTIWTVDSLLADGHLRFTVGTYGDGSFAVVFRAVDSNNYLMVQGRQSASTLQYAFQRRVGGTPSTVASSGSTASAAGDVVDILMAGTSITVTVNGSPLFGGARTESNFSTATKHGILLQAGSSGNESIDQISMTRN